MSSARMLWTRTMHWRWMPLRAWPQGPWLFYTWVQQFSLQFFFLVFYYYIIEITDGCSVKFNKYFVCLIYYFCYSIEIKQNCYYHFSNSGLYGPFLLGPWHMHQWTMLLYVFFLLQFYKVCSLPQGRRITNHLNIWIWFSAGKAGWQGEDCSVVDQQVYQCLPGCSEHGTYDLETGQCVCERHWTGPDCSQGK